MLRNPPWSRRKAARLRGPTSASQHDNTARERAPCQRAGGTTCQNDSLATGQRNTTPAHQRENRHHVSKFTRPRGTTALAAPQRATREHDTMLARGNTPVCQKHPISATCSEIRSGLSTKTCFSKTHPCNLLRDSGTCFRTWLKSSNLH